MLTSEEKSFEEKRQFRRLPLKEAVRYEFKDPRRFGACTSSDISEGGIKLTLNDFVPLETDLTLQINLNEGQLVECTGRVIWVEKLPFWDAYRAGLKFNLNELYFKSKKSIREFIQSEIQKNEGVSLYTL